jgi:hypothetical protein
MVTIMTGYYSFERVSTEIVNFGTRCDDRYRDWEDEKYKRFLKKHGFRPNPRVYDLYLRLCAADLVE